MTDRSDGTMNELTGMAIELDLNKKLGIELNELERLDILTPIHSLKMDLLPVQRRKILASIVRYGNPARICEIANFSRIYQQNKISSQIGRLVKEGILERVGRGRYYLRNDEFHKYLIIRLEPTFETAFMSRKIPDKESPITYFINNRDKFIEAYN